MNIIRRRFIISLVTTAAIGIFIFFINDTNTELGASFGAYVKLQFARYFGLVIGVIALLAGVMLRASKKTAYADYLFYIFTGVFNLALGIYGAVYMISDSESIPVMHQFLINLLLGVLISADVFLTNNTNGSN